MVKVSRSSVSRPKDPVPGHPRSLLPPTRGRQSRRPLSHPSDPHPTTPGESEAPTGSGSDTKETEEQPTVREEISLLDRVARPPLPLPRRRHPSSLVLCLYFTPLPSPPLSPSSLSLLPLSLSLSFSLLFYSPFSPYSSSLYLPLPVFVTPRLSLLPVCLSSFPLFPPPRATLSSRVSTVPLYPHPSFFNGPKPRGRCVGDEGVGVWGHLG